MWCLGMTVDMTLHGFNEQRLWAEALVVTVDDSSCSNCLALGVGYYSIEDMVSLSTIVLLGSDGLAGVPQHFLIEDRDVQVILEIIIKC